MKYQDYTVGWICALPTEMGAAVWMLEERHPPLPRRPRDDNTLYFRSHRTAYGCPRLHTVWVDSTSSAADVARDMSQV
jgi:hypothetical protein